jgi:predicted house-cleaning NTP pyrophosphatase (Maf/HAM1 superfamily)
LLGSIASFTTDNSSKQKLQNILNAGDQARENTIMKSRQKSVASRSDEEEEHLFMDKDENFYLDDHLSNKPKSQKEETQAIR